MKQIIQDTLYTKHMNNLTSLITFYPIALNKTYCINRWEQRDESQ